VGEVVVVLLGERQSDGDLTTASRQDEEARASQDQARKSRTDDGAGDWVRLAINEIIP
jgi:predicted negative regulator of RcsB-dependent stress response